MGNLKVIVIGPVESEKFVGAIEKIKNEFGNDVTIISSPEEAMVMGLNESNRLPLIEIQRKPIVPLEIPEMVITEYKSGQQLRNERRLKRKVK